MQRYRPDHARITVHYLRPFYGSMFLILTLNGLGFTTKGRRLQLINSTETERFFLQHGSDNWPCFTDNMLEVFIRNNGIRDIILAPYHPASNWLSKHAVQNFKTGLRTMTMGTIYIRSNKQVLVRLSHNTPHNNWIITNLITHEA